MPLFGAQFNWWLDDEKIFAAVGSNRVCGSGTVQMKTWGCVACCIEDKEWHCVEK